MHNLIIRLDRHLDAHAGFFASLGEQMHHLSCL